MKAILRTTARMGCWSASDTNPASHLRVLYRGEPTVHSYCLLLKVWTALYMVLYLKTI